MQFSSHPQWIWTSGPASPRNFWLRLRRVFSLSPNLQRATLLITADSRYQLFVNNTPLGHGPIRSFPWSYSYDEYDITPWLHTSTENCLGVQVVHWGDHTFQYIRGRGGFLCELLLEYTDGRTEHLASDDQWTVSPDPAIISKTPRIALQQGFEEHYDARLADTHWQLASFPATNWQPAIVLGPIGIAPWLELIPRSIPFLSSDTLFPTRILSAELARPKQGYRWCFDLRYLYASAQIGQRGEVLGQRGRAFVTEIITTQPCEIKVYYTLSYDSQQLSCNGQQIHAQTTTLSLHAGRNLFITIGTEWPSLLFETSANLQFDASQLVSSANETYPWAFFAPFNERDQQLEKQLLQSTNISSLPNIPRMGIPLSENMPDIAHLTSTQDFLLPPGGFCDTSINQTQPRTPLNGEPRTLIENSAHLLHQNALATILHPQPDGDIHLIIDFERELLGFIEFELDAPAGTIIDVNLFEGIDESGIFWMERMRNSFRYTCREGYQTYRSHQRRGFRYASLTIRGATRPIQFYSLLCLLSTYPIEKRGTFTCNDALLTKIWEVAAYTVQLCMEDTYTDCPGYEQTFWVGDARNSSLVNAVAFGAYPLTERCLRLTAQSLSHKLDYLKPPHLHDYPHLTTDHVNSGWYSQIPMWSFLWIWNIWEHYQLTGDITTLADLYPAVHECLQRCLTFLTDRHLVDIPYVWNLVDWAATDLTSDGEVTSTNALLVESLRQAAKMANTLAAHQNLNDDEAKTLYNQATIYLQQAEAIRSAINTYCWSEARSAYVDTIRDEPAYNRMLQHAKAIGNAPETLPHFLSRTRISEPTNTLVLQCDCATPERTIKIFPLVEAAHKGNFVGSDPGQSLQWPQDQTVPVGSPWFLFFTLETLLKYGQVEDAISLIREQWGRMLEKGATTFWETFPNTTGEHWSRSLCHGWSAAPAYFLSTQILGIQPAEPGYTHVLITPHTCGLHHAEGTVPTPRGDIYVHWTRTTTYWTIKINLPPNTPATLRYENTHKEPLYISGNPGTTQQTNGEWQVQLVPGSQTIYQVPL